MTKILELPQLQAVFSYDIPEKQVVLVSGGQAPAKSWLKQKIVLSSADVLTMF